MHGLLTIPKEHNFSICRSNDDKNDEPEQQEMIC